MIWSHRKGWYFLIWSWDFLALWGMLNAWHYVLEASQNCDRLTIGLTNMYYKWAIKLFGNYKKSVMIRKVCWMYYKSNGKFMINYFIVYLKIRLLNYFKFFIMSFYYYMKGKWSIFIRKFISILRIVWIVWRLFIKVDVSIKYLIYMHSYQMLMELKTLLGFVAHPIIFQCTGSSLKAAKVLEVVRNLRFSFVRIYNFCCIVV